MLSPQTLTEQFPILKRCVNSRPLVYLDNAATTHKPLSVIKALEAVYTEYNSNVHRGSHTLSRETTSHYEASRKSVQRFINASAAEEIIWTQGTTDGINLVARGLADKIAADDEIVITAMEHHANLVPWQQLAKSKGAKLVVLPVDENGELSSGWEALITEKCKVLAVTYASNVTGVINPVSAFIQKAKAVSAFTLIDAAQAVVHLPIDVQALDCDFLCFSGHKMYGPNGIGVLYGKKTKLDMLTPSQFGGEMIDSVSFDQTTFAQLPNRLEAGTPNYPAAIGLAAAIDFISQLGTEDEHRLIEDAQWLSKQLSQLPGVQLIADVANKLPIVTFIVANHQVQDIAIALDGFGIAVRTGHHCAMPLMQELGLSDGAIRVSLAVYNRKNELVTFITALKSILTEHQDEGLRVTESAELSTLKDKFSANQSWDFQYRELLRMGKRLTGLDASLKTEENRLKGCESSVWLVVENNDNKLTFAMDSDAKIIRGLILLLSTYLQSMTASEIATFDFEEEFTQLGFLRHLSPSRGNGFVEIIRQVQLSARQA